MSVSSSSYHTQALATADALRQTVLAMGLNPQQLAACQHVGHEGLQVLAGAGTGKTLLITARYLWLLAEALQSHPADAPERLWVLTFTVDAAAEMRHRIHHALLRAGYTGSLPMDTLGNFNQLGQKLLAAHYPLLGKLSSPQTLDATQQSQLLESLMANVLRGQLPQVERALMDQGLSQLDPRCLSPDRLALWPTQQREAILASFIAGVDSVKALGLSPQQAYAVLSRQSEQWQATLASLPLVQLPNGFALETHSATALAWSRHLAAYASPTWQEQLRWACADDTLMQKDFQALFVDDKLHKATGWFGRPNKAMIRWSDLAHQPKQAMAGVLANAPLQAQVLEAFCAFYAVYQQQLSLANQCDFNDQITLATQLLQAHPTLAQRYQQGVCALSVDEFQDTNGA